MRYMILAVAVLVTLPLLAGTDEGLAAMKDRRYDDAFRELVPAAEGGDTRAQNGLGILYINGHGVEKDFETAFSWFERSARAGFHDAQFQVGIAYLNGIGVEQDYVQSLAWFLVAKNSGSETAGEGVGACQSAMKSKQIDRANKLAVTLTTEIAANKR
ncbi:MAG: sel1 repeat family protein [Acidobacteriota bacterium]|nr:sel1 repeat family protein [Acidobacteriota bacterium]MDH3784843.1 sel1 repeat family protein [Acidobacteriota bacterium]